MNGPEPANDRKEVRRTDMDIEQLLARTRFVPSRSFEARLHRELLNRLCESGNKEERSVFGVFRSAVRPLLVSSVSAIFVFGGVLALSPDARAGVGDWVSRFVEVESPTDLQSPPQVSITSNSEVRPPGSEQKPISPPQATTSGEIGGIKPVLPEQMPPLPDVKPTRDLTSLQDAQARVSFKIQMPGSLPNGYKFQGVVPVPALPGDIAKGLPNAPSLPADAPKIEPPQSVILIFGNDKNETAMLSEARMGNPAGIQLPLPAGPSSVKDVTVKGQSAQYIEGSWGRDGKWVASGNHQLHWQDSAGIVFDLSSQTLGLSDLLTIANSLK